MTRGLTDSDLDNPQTSTAIIRQYINATQEGLLGETQEEDPETFGESMPGKALKGVKKGAEAIGGVVADPVLDKVRDRNRDIKSQFFDYSVGSDGLTLALWKKNVAKAYDPGGLYKSKEVMSFDKRFAKLEKAQAAVNPAAADPGKEKTDAAFRLASEAAQATLDELRSALLAYAPTANPQGKDPHECMKIYVGDLLMEVGKQSAALSKMRDAYWKSSFLIKANGDQNEAEKLEAEVSSKAEKDAAKRSPTSMSCGRRRSTNACRRRNSIRSTGSSGWEIRPAGRSFSSRPSSGLNSRPTPIKTRSRD